MEQIKDKTVKTFTWTDENVIGLCAFLNNHLTKYGRNTPFRWSELQPDNEKLVNYDFNSKQALKNKYDGMRKEYSLWKRLKHGETGLGWNESTGKLVCSNEWWNKKIEEDPKVGKFQRKQPSMEVQEAWDQLFGDTVARGTECVAPSMDSTKLKEIPRINLEDEDVGGDATGPCDVYNQYSSHLENLETVDKGFFRGFMNTMQGEDGFNVKQEGGSEQPSNSSKTNIKPKPVKMKRKGRESSGASLFKDYMARQDDAQERVLKILEAESFDTNEAENKRFTVPVAMDVIKRMVAEGLMIKRDELWFFAMKLIQDTPRREVFLTLDNDDDRLAWLQHEQQNPS